NMSRALIILSALLCIPANALALSDLDTRFLVQLHGHLKRTVPCDFLTISNGNLSCRGILFEQIPISRIKRLDVVYMGKEYNVSDLNESDIKSVNAMSMKKEKAVAVQQRVAQARAEQINRQKRTQLASTEGVDFSHGLPSEQAFKYIEQQRTAWQPTIDSIKNKPYDQKLNSAQIKQIEDIAQKIAAQSNANKQAMLDKMTMSFNATAVGRNVRFENVIRVKKGLPPQKIKVWLDATRDEIVPKACAHNAKNPAFDRGLSYTFAYSNAYGEKLGEVFVDKPVCVSLGLL
ncbi:MAG: hypothetical protein D3910_06610, partial [Candidatus Electrothrix sp. ATG2]|nr:hypothetical protein [Candidatus Electrothrix sp. ATG2]